MLTFNAKGDMMGWRFEQKDDKFRVWSTVVDDYLTDWLDRSQVLEYIYESRLRQFKKEIIEVSLTFPDKTMRVESNIFHSDMTRRDVHTKWIKALHLLKGDTHDTEIDRAFQEALDSMGVDEAPVLFKDDPRTKIKAGG